MNERKIERMNMKGPSKKKPRGKPTAKLPSREAPGKENVSPLNTESYFPVDGEGAFSSSARPPPLGVSSIGKRPSSEHPELPKKKRGEAFKPRNDCHGSNESFASTSTTDDNIGYISMDSPTALPSVAEPSHQLDEKLIKTYDFHKRGDFLNYRKEARKVASDKSKKMAPSNVHQYLLEKDIVELDFAPKGLESAYHDFKKQFQGKIIDIDKSYVDACSAFELEIATTGLSDEQDISNEKNDEIRKFLLQLYWSSKVSLVDCMRRNESSFSQSITKKLWQNQFPESTGYALSWGDGAQLNASEGNLGKDEGKILEGDLMKSGGQDYTLCHIAIKRPNLVYRSKKYIFNYYQLVMKCKRTIEDAANSEHSKHKCSAAVYYGCQMFVYTMTYYSGFYHWSLLGQSPIPCDRSNFSSVYPVLRLLHSLQVFLGSDENLKGQNDSQAIPKEGFLDSPHSPGRGKSSKKRSVKSGPFQPLEEEAN